MPNDLPPAGTAIQLFLQEQPGGMRPFAPSGVAIAAIVTQATPEPKAGHADPKKPWSARQVDLTYFLPSQSPSWLSGVTFLGDGEEPTPEWVAYCRLCPAFLSFDPPAALANAV